MREIFEGAALRCVATRRAKGPRPSRPLAAILVLSLLPAISALPAQQTGPGEYQVKAAYLYQFGRFVHWPAALVNHSFSICVLGRDPFGPTLETALTGETIDGKDVVPKRISRPQDALSCNILFISSSEEKELSSILAAIDRAGVLTVSEIPGFSQRGGMIQLLSQGRRVRFEVNLAVAGSAGLTLSSELLKLAVSVRRNPVPGN